MKKTFNNGDKVKLIHNRSGSYNNVGDIGIVKNVDKDEENCDVIVKGYEDREGILSTFSDLELVASQVDSLIIF